MADTEKKVMKILETILVVLFAVFLILFYVEDQFLTINENSYNVIAPIAPTDPSGILIDLENYFSNNVSQANTTFAPIIFMGVIIIIFAFYVYYRAYYDIFRDRRTKRASSQKLLTPEKTDTAITRRIGSGYVKPKTEKCFFCGYKIPENITNCPRCGNARMRCSVCNRDIILGDQLVKCPHCGALSHKEHLAEAEGIMEKGVCPKCGEKLEEIKIITPKSKCFYCGLEIPRDAEYCPHCGESRVRCSVCLGDIASGDQFVKCPNCGVLSHRNHMLEWIKVKGYCPNCRQKLKEIDTA
jgi:predicted RNA-binding Zn-ribbon protein involved in translation (DUF1610 family)